MLAIDTVNVVVRYLAGDDPEQSRKAKVLIDSEDIFICTTVLLETEWCRRSVYGLTAIDAAKALTAFAGLEGVTLEGLTGHSQGAGLGQPRNGFRRRSSLGKGGIVRCHGDVRPTVRKNCQQIERH